MITKEYIDKEIEDLLNDNHHLNRCEVEELYNLMSIRDMWCSAGEVTRHITAKDAEEWIIHLVNADGTTGQKWSKADTNAVLASKGFDLDPLEFYATMNMLHSDYVNVANQFGVDNADFFAYLTLAFLDDEDAKENKLCAYRKYIAK